MPLNPLKLQRAFFLLSTVEKPPDAFTAASRIASAYREYAADGVSLGFPLGLPGPGVAAMDGALGAALAIKPGIPPVVAAGYLTMVNLFWTGAVFPALPSPGVAAPPIGGPALLAALTALFSIPNPTEIYAATVAAALDACTRTVLVTFPQPSPPPLVGPVV